MTSPARRAALVATLLITVTNVACDSLEVRDEFEEDENAERESAAGVTCSGSETCSGADTVFTSAYRIGATATSRGDLLQTFTAALAGRPSTLSLVARSLRPFTASPAPQLHVRVYGPVVGDVATLSRTNPVLTADVPVSAIASGAPTSIALEGGALVAGATYALHLSVDGVGATGSGTVLVGIGAMSSLAYGGGAAFRATERSSTPWSAPAPSRFRPAGAWDVAFAFSGTVSSVDVVEGAGGRTWSDGSSAASCDGYRHPPANHAYAGAVGDGAYLVDPDGPGGAAPFAAHCDMVGDDGGWTLVSRARAGDNVTGFMAAAGDFRLVDSLNPAGGSFKFADATINALKSVAFRVQITGTYVGTRFFKAACAYDHTSNAALVGDCLNSYADTAWNGLVAGSNRYSGHAGLSDWTGGTALFVITRDDRPTYGWFTGNGSAWASGTGATNGAYTLWVR